MYSLANIRLVMRVPYSTLLVLWVSRLNGERAAEVIFPQRTCQVYRRIARGGRGTAQTLPFSAIEEGGVPFPILQIGQLLVSNGQ